MSAPTESAPSEAERSLGRLWDYLRSWTAADGGVNGPVVHRGDLKRTGATHDTAWTQGPVIEGLVCLYHRSGNDYWLEHALRLADAQCSRLLPDGSFRWAGHEDDRFSALVSNALADCGLLALCEILCDASDGRRRQRYLAVVERNIRDYIIAQLYRRDLSGFCMNAVDYYTGRDRFVVNMNSLATEAIIRLSELRGTAANAAIVRQIGEKILSLQCTSDPNRGAFAYSDIQLQTFVTLYTALTLRGLPHLGRYLTAAPYREATSRTLENLGSMEDPDSGLWWHERQGDLLRRYPIFVAGAGIILNGILDATRFLGQETDLAPLTARLLPHQLPIGGFRGFVGYDHPDNARRRGSGKTCWEDVFPTTSWNAHAFHYLCRVAPPPQPPKGPSRLRVVLIEPRFAYVETRRLALVIGWIPFRSMFFGLFVKALRHAVIIHPRRMIEKVRVWLSRAVSGLKLRRTDRHGSGDTAPT